jgi:hypothetical protein
MQPEEFFNTKHSSKPPSDHGKLFAFFTITGSTKNETQRLENH